MHNVTLTDKAYEVATERAARLKLNVDTYLSTVLLGDIGNAPIDRNSPLFTGIGLFADAPELVDAVLADIMEARTRRWQHTDDESHS